MTQTYIAHISTVAHNCHAKELTSRQKEKPHAKKKNLRAKRKRLAAKRITSRQKKNLDPRHQRKRGGWREFSRCTMG